MQSHSAFSSNAGTGASTPIFGHSSIWHNIERVDSSNTVASGDTRYLDEELASLISTLSALQTNQSNTNTGTNYYYNDNGLTLTTNNSHINNYPSHRLQMSTLEGNKEEEKEEDDSVQNKYNKYNNGRRLSSSSATST